MGAIPREMEIHRACEQSIQPYSLSAEVSLRFLPCGEEGLFLEPALPDADKASRFLPAVRRGLEACMAFYHLSGVRAVWTDVLLGSGDACDVAVTWAAALALREAVSSGGPGGQDPAKDAAWLREAGLYTEREEELGAYRREQLRREHPWVDALSRAASKEERLAILRDAAGEDSSALALLAAETGDREERFLLRREQAVRDDNPFLLAEIGECYEVDGGRPVDRGAVELFMKLGDAYREWRDQLDPAWDSKMSEAYERAWRFAGGLGLAENPSTQEFAERVGDAFADREEPFFSTDLAAQWYRRAGAARWEVRVKLALLAYRREECLYLGDCFANGTPPAQRDDRMAERFYQRVRLEALSTSRERSSAGERVPYGQAPLDAMIEERLGDLYAREDSPLCSWDLAFECYKTAAPGSDSAKGKALEMMRRKKGPRPEER